MAAGRTSSRLRCVFLALAGRRGLSELQISGFSMRITGACSGLAVWRDGCVGSSKAGVGRRSVVRGFGDEGARHLVGVKVGLGNDVSCFSRRKHRIGEELLDQVGVMGLKELHQVDMNMIFNPLHDFLHFELLFIKLSHQLVCGLVKVHQLVLHDSEITVPLLIELSLCPVR